ncbi:MAG: hypothetical protein LLH30_12290 [Candidatus Manganitrophus sp. SA1]|nr:hypothetical protein [Candidatus Manganitrophus morganii]
MKLEIPIRKQISLFSMMVAFVLFFTGCQGGEENGTASVRLSFNLSSSKTGAAKTASAPAPSGITSVRIDVTGPGMELLSDSVAVNSEEETVVDLEIPAGPARRFVVTAFDSEEQPRFIGETTVDLEPGTSPTIRIAMIEIDVEVPQIEIAPTSTILTRSEPENPQTETFTLTNATTAEVSLLINGTQGENPELGQIVLGENPNEFIYTAPEIIPIQRTNTTDIGVPIPITIAAIDQANSQRLGIATVKLVTGPFLLFGPNDPVYSTTGGLISTDSAGQRGIAFHNGRVYVVWTENGEGTQVLFSESEDGFEWTQPLPLGTVGRTPSPTIAVGPDGSVYVTFLGVRTVCQPSFCTSNATIEVMVRRPNSTFQFLSSSPLMTNLQVKLPAIAVSNTGTVYVAWSAEGNGGTTDIYFQRLTSDGAPIDETPRNLSGHDTTLFETNPTLSVGATGQVFLAWEISGQTTFFQNIFATASTDGGTTFLPAVQVNNTGLEFDPEEIAFASRPSIAAGPQGTVYIAWDRDRCNDGCLVPAFDVGRLGSSGLEFGPDRDLNTDSTFNFIRPSVAWDGANGVYVSFLAPDSDIGDMILLAKSTNEGETFEISRIDNGTTSNIDHSASSIAVDSAGRVFAAWTREVFIPQNESSRYDLVFSMGDDFQFSNSETTLLTRSASVSQE